VLKTIRALLENLHSNEMQGYRVLVRGKINSSDRTRGFFIKHGYDIPVSTFSARMLYAMWHSDARTGSFGIRA
jgi:ribosomal protein S3